MDLQVSPVFLKNAESNKRYVVNQGGMRSGKTYSILQTLILKYALKSKGLFIDVARKTQAELHDSVVRDFFKILDTLPIRNKPKQVQSKLSYQVHGNTFSFIGIDKPQKKRGPQRDLLFINEANGITLDDWVQLSGRTGGQIFLDYNPSEYFWINELILEKDSSKFDLIRSTYLDNYDFLPAWQVQEIENLISIDDFYYKVYVLGELAIMKGKIYNGYTLIEPSEYDELYEDEKFYGLDFGYENATSLIEVKWCNEKVYEREMYRATHKYDSDLLRWMNENNISQTADIYADPANSAGISLLRDSGYNIRHANKAVWDGIRFCQGLKRFICKSSIAYIKEINSYKFKQTSNGEIIEEPVKINDHCVDAMRYSEFTHLAKRFMPYG